MHIQTEEKTKMQESTLERLEHQLQDSMQESRNLKSELEVLNLLSNLDNSWVDMSHVFLILSNLLMSLKLRVEIPFCFTGYEGGV